MKHGDNLHLLIVEESKNDAESLANALRNAGHSIQFKHGSSMEEIESALSSQQPDIVVCGSGEEIPAHGEVHKLLGRHESNAPLIAITEEATEADVVAARKAGITSLVSYDQPDHLNLVFDHEVNILRLTQQLGKIQDALSSSESRCHELIENSSDAVAYIHDGMHVYANQPYMDLFAIETREDVDGTPILDMITEDHRDTFKGFLKDYLEQHAEDNVHAIDCLSPAGEVFHCSMELSPATMDGEPCTQIIIRVNASNAELEKKLEAMSRVDMLTGLSNRQHFMRQLDKRLASTKDSDSHRALIYITLDNFKTIREECGIASSDMVLCDIARLLEKNSGENDCLSRFGDFSFAIYHSDNSEEEILGLGETLLHKISGHLSEVEGRAITTTGSIGICPINKNARSAQKIITNADMACEVARSSGGNQIHTHSAVVDEKMGLDNEQEWDNIIRHTIDDERFFLAYQPIVSLKGDTNQRYEVLLRVVDEAGHVILPGQFLSIAEKTGVIGEIDRWIISTAFKQLVELREQQPDSTFYIKLSGATLTDSDLPLWINEQLKQYRLVSDGVIFEIGERTATNNLTNAKAFVTTMQSINCKVAFEHYGQSNQPQLLNHVPVDILKIDGALINGLSSSKENQARVKEIIALAKENNKETVAECVDDAGGLAQLWQFGVDYIQGNFVQAPSKDLEYDFEGEIA